MRSKILSVLALSIIVVEAFRDTSPFFIFSTSEILTSSPRIVSAASLSKNISAELQKCSSETYVIVSQPAVNAADYHDLSSAPSLRWNIVGENKNIRSSMTVADVIGALDAESMSKEVQARCGAEILRVDASTRSFIIPESIKTRVIAVDFPALPSGKDRASKLVDNDAFLASILDVLPSPKYTVLYITTPISAELLLTIEEGENYQIETNFNSVVHMELKRDFSDHTQASNRSAVPRSAPLFEKYQFFGPGLFMGLLVTSLLVSILYIGIAGIASLQVSYAAFDKETGPAASKK